MDSPILNIISLCSGVGMLDVGVAAGLEFLGVRGRTIMYAEREAYPVSVLESRIEEGSLDAAPVWFGDFTELDGRQFSGVVDCIVAGFPCQDLSVAGNRAGLDGERSGLFFNILRFANDSGARFLFLENVAGIASATATVMDGTEKLEERAASRVLGELADCGWDAEWLTLSASDVGASHGRARWFCLAWRKLADTSGRELSEQRRRQEERSGSGSAIHPLADPARHDKDRQSGQGGCRRGICTTGNSLVNAEHAGLPAAEIGKGLSTRNDPHPPGSIDAGEPSGSGVSSGQMDNTICDGWRARRMPDREHDRNIPAATGEIALDDTTGTGRQKPGSCRQRELPAEAGSGLHHRPQQPGAQLADTNSTRQRTGRRCRHDCARYARPVSEQSGDIRLANTIMPGSQISQLKALQRARGGDEGRATSELCGLFAPGPGDPRWTDIIREWPETAPSLEPDFCSLVNGLAFAMADCRAARLKCIGNGVVPLQAAVAFIVLARRAGILTY